MHFTSDWFTPHVASWTAIVAPALAGQPCRALEIGSYEGRSMAWLLAHALTHPAARLMCVDSWVVRGTEQRFDANAVETGAGHKVEKRKGDSAEVLRGLSGAFDFIYIDGDHTFPGVLTDTILTLPLLKTNGLMIWDDYDHPGFPGCRKAVDVVLDAWGFQFEVLARGRQVIARKIG